MLIIMENTIPLLSKQNIDSIPKMYNIEQKETENVKYLKLKTKTNDN